jgi:hypothetical protein
MLNEKVEDLGFHSEFRNPQSAIRNNWADAFSAQRPYFRATSLLFYRKENNRSEGGQGKWIANFTFTFSGKKNILSLP